MSSSNMNKISIKKGPSENTLTVTTKDPLEINVELPNQDTLLKLKKQKGRLLKYNVKLTLQNKKLKEENKELSSQMIVQQELQNAIERSLQEVREDFVKIEEERNSLRNDKDILQQRLQASQMEIRQLLGIQQNVNETCRICLNRPREVILQPCGHDCFCYTCINTLYDNFNNQVIDLEYDDQEYIMLRCPVCRTQLEPTRPRRAFL